MDASIHFPLAREDGKENAIRRPDNASIHFPLAREDEKASKTLASFDASIHFPLAREDVLPSRCYLLYQCFNPLPSCEGRRLYFTPWFQSYMLQSTSLLRGKTEIAVSEDFAFDASIHFPLAREDIYDKRL